MLCLSDSIRHDDPDVQPSLAITWQAQTLTELVIAAWTLVRLIGVQVIESVLAERAQQPTCWPTCPPGGQRLHTQGLVKRQMTSLVGWIRWRRRVGRCPSGCTIGQVAPFDETLGLSPHQRSRQERHALGCAVAVLVPFATAAPLLSWYRATPVSPWAVWPWVQAAGPEAMSRLEAEWKRLESGEEPEAEPMAPELAHAPLARGDDGVMGPFRPHGGRPEGKTQWREVKVGVLARLPWHWTRNGKPVMRLAPRRLVAVLGDIEGFKPRLGLEVLRPGMPCAAKGVWLNDGDRGLWRLSDDRFRYHGQGILDFYHGAHNLWNGAAARLDGRTKPARRGLGWARHRLRHGHPDDVRGDVAEALEIETLPESPRERLGRSSSRDSATTC